jgi:hypothetical protein
MRIHRCHFDCNIYDFLRSFFPNYFQLYCQNFSLISYLFTTNRPGFPLYQVVTESLRGQVRQYPLIVSKTGIMLQRQLDCFPDMANHQAVPIRSINEEFFPQAYANFRAMAQYQYYCPITLFSFDCYFYDHFHFHSSSSFYLSTFMLIILL